jgi:2-methylcitrate dehydratase PrpD
LTARFVAEIRQIAGGHIPEDVRVTALCCILDWLGTAHAGMHEAAVAALLEDLLTAPAAPCGLIGRPERTSAQGAALVNGTAGDALDFSDVNRSLNGHATATVWPCVLALAEAHGAPGAAALRAFIAGVEAACRVGLLLGPGILETPFHPTPIAGAVGAAAGGAVLLNLDDERFAAALGIAATQAAGLAGAVGTMCKPLHAGTAAAAGTLAAQLALRGFTAPAAVLDPGAGFLEAHTAHVVADALDASRGRWLILETLLKEHAACALAGGSIENMRALRRTGAFDAAGVESVRLQLAPSSVRVCDILAPRTGLEVKFSVRTVAAMALLGYDTALPGSFTDAVAGAEDIAALRARISVEGRPDLDVAESRATIELRDGRVLERTFDERRVDRDPAVRRARTRTKFAALTAPYLSPGAAAALETRIFALEEAATVDVRP